MTNEEFNLDTKDKIKREIDHQFIRLATELKESIEDNFSKANERLVIQQVLINTLKSRIDKAIETINLMIYKGYTISSKGTARSYMATGENSEFGVRAKELLDILKGEKDERN